MEASHPNRGVEEGDRMKPISILRESGPVSAQTNL